ncbi:MAG TPA: serine/threonine-protein kinase [Kofleriaceae bacterium]|nr:serine/threonine-protein kinase [Kofleriaceae bacterium]
MVGTVIDGRYRLDAELGQGGMGTVFRATHLRTGRQVAIKVLLPEWAQAGPMAARFEREARAAGFLKHTNLVDVLALGRIPDGPLYLVMELVVGTPLGDLIDEGGALEPGRALRLARQALDGIGFAHAHGFIHRDIKPDNLMIAGEPGRELVKVLDFGLVKLVGLAAAELGAEKLTATGMVFGTPVYMAPEQALGRVVDHRADLYALGLVLFEMLTGEPPFYSEQSSAVLRMHAGAPRPRLVDRGLAPDRATEALEALVARAMAVRPDDRFGSAGEMIAAIDAAAASLAG